MKVIVAHPGKQHSFQTATAFKKSGDLYKYITTVYNKPHSWTSLLSKLVKGDLRKKIIGRRCNELDDSDVIQFNELYVIVTLFLNRISGFTRVAGVWNGIVESSFYKKVMKYAKKHNVDAIIVYNGYAKKYFELIEDTGILKFIDVSIAGREYLRDILQREIDLTGIEQIKKDHFTYWDKKMIKNDIDGCKRADYFLVPSEFVKTSILSQGIKPNQILKVPYGVNVSHFNISENSKSTSGPLKLIYTGGIAYRKGLHRLFNVLKNFKEDEIELYLAGAYDPTSELYLQNKDKTNIHFLGFVTRDKLNAAYNAADVFVLPSFAEGMAMVGLEAQACGLPMICTFNSGVNDVVIDGVNGFVYDPFDEKRLEDILRWCCNNREKLLDMVPKAVETAKNYTWNIYHENLVNAVKEKVERIK